jgi:succinate dehydrogenase / fumarate reductase flavoprotein subunit
MYHDITGEDPYEVPMRIYPAPHYTMGGLWVDYNLMSNLEGLFVIGEANFSDHGANRLGASALMQGLADGYFIIGNAVSNYLADKMGKKVTTDRPEFKAAEAAVQESLQKLLKANGTRSVDSFHRELGNIMWEKCGMARSAESLTSARREIAALRERYWKEVRVIGEGEEPNQSLEKAMRVADFFELAELMCIDALHREESCGGHFRVEYQTEDGEAKRNDEKFTYVAAWEWTGAGADPVLHKEPLIYENVKLTTRSYK